MFDFAFFLSLELLISRLFFLVSHHLFFLFLLVMFEFLSAWIG